MKKRLIPKMAALAMAIAMALTVTVSAAQAPSETETQPYNAAATSVTCAISYLDQLYRGSIIGPTTIPKTEVTLILYEENSIGFIEVDSAKASADTYVCSKTVDYPIEKGTTYKLTIIAKAYVDNVWDTVTKSIVVTP